MDLFNMIKRPSLDQLSKQVIDQQNIIESLTSHMPSVHTVGDSEILSVTRLRSEISLLCQNLQNYQTREELSELNKSLKRSIQELNSLIDSNVSENKLLSIQLANLEEVDKNKENQIKSLKEQLSIAQDQINSFQRDFQRDLEKNYGDGIVALHNKAVLADLRRNTEDVKKIQAAYSEVVNELNTQFKENTIQQGIVLSKEEEEAFHIAEEQELLARLKKNPQAIKRVKEQLGKIKQDLENKIENKSREFSEQLFHTQNALRTSYRILEQISSGISHSSPRNLNEPNERSEGQVPSSDDSIDFTLPGIAVQINKAQLCLMRLMPELMPADSVYVSLASINNEDSRMGINEDLEVLLGQQTTIEAEALKECKVKIAEQHNDLIEALEKLKAESPEYKCQKKLLNTSSIELKFLNTHINFNSSLSNNSPKVIRSMFRGAFQDPQFASIDLVKACLPLKDNSLSIDKYIREFRGSINKINEILKKLKGYISLLVQGVQQGNNSQNQEIAEEASNQTVQSPSRRAQLFSETTLKLMEPYENELELAFKRLRDLHEKWTTFESDLGQFMDKAGVNLASSSAPKSPEARKFF
jgi:hypothetical protein